MSPAAKTALILTAGAAGALLGTLVGYWIGGGSEQPLGLALGLGLGLAVQALVTYKVVSA